MDVRLCRTCGTPVSASRPSARSLLTIMIHMHSVKDKCIIWIVCHAKASCHSSESICHLNYDCFPCSILYLLKTVKTRRNGLFPPFLAQVKQGLLVLPVPSKIIIKSLCLFFSFLFFPPHAFLKSKKWIIMPLVGCGWIFLLTTQTFWWWWWWFEVCHRNDKCCSVTEQSVLGLSPLVSFVNKFLHNCLIYPHPQVLYELFVLYANLTLTDEHNIWRAHGFFCLPLCQ